MKKVVIIGAGINGLVAANYLVRAGFDVTVLERKDHPGGACCSAIWTQDGIEYVYPQGASVLGFMEDFVFEETGLSKRVSIYRPEHPEIVYGSNDLRLGLIWDDPAKTAKGAKEHWNEQGDLVAFLKDMDLVVAFLQDGYQKAVVPTVESATKALGSELVSRWITGGARALLNHYLTSEPLKLFYAVSVIESGPISLDAPYSAFTIPLMASGSIFDGEWGYVRDGIWQIPLQLDALNAEQGVRRIFSARVAEISRADMSVRYEHQGKEKLLSADYILFATDPFSAARILGEESLLDMLEKEKVIGTSGKLVMFFKNPVQWKDDTGMKDFESAFRHIIPAKDLDEFEKLSNAVVDQGIDFTPGYFEIYCEGAGNRELGGIRSYDLVSVFFKNLAFSKTGEELPEVKKKVESYILSRVRNPEDLIHTILETPKDIADLFFFPKGNIDAIDLAEGQTFFQRTYSPDPKNNFYQFGSDPRIFYCAAGAYPCGSVAGTPGYMCAKQLIQRAGLSAKDA